MKTAVSITLLLAVVSVSAVGVGYVIRRHGQAAAPAPTGITPPVTTTPTVPPATIAVGEPAPGRMYAGGSATFDETTGRYITDPVPFGSSTSLSEISTSWLDAISGVRSPLIDGVVRPGPIRIDDPVRLLA